MKNQTSSKPEALYKHVGRTYTMVSNQQQNIQLASNHGEQTLFGSTKEHVKVEVPNWQLRGGTIRYNDLEDFSLEMIRFEFWVHDPVFTKIQLLQVCCSLIGQGGLLTSFSWSSSRFQRIHEMPTVLLVASPPQKKEGLEHVLE